MKKLKQKLNIITLALLFSPAVSLAAKLVPNSDKAKDTSLLDFLNRIKGVLLGVVGALSVLFIVIGGVQYVMSAGNPQKIETAKKTLTYAIIGLLFVILAQVILGLITGDFAPSIFGPGTLTKDEF